MAHEVELPAYEGLDIQPPSLTIFNDPVPIRIGDDGAVRVGPTRVTLTSVIYAFKEGASPEEIQQRFSSLHLADIYSTIAYYLRHTEEIEAFLTWEEAEAEKIRQKIEAQWPSNGLRDQLSARLATQQSTQGDQPDAETGSR